MERGFIMRRNGLFSYAWFDASLGPNMLSRMRSREVVKTKKRDDKLRALTLSNL